MISLLATAHRHRPRPHLRPDPRLEGAASGGAKGTCRGDRVSTPSSKLTPVGALLYLLAAPWFLLWAITVVVGRALTLVRRVRALPLALSDEVACVAGHRNSLLGRWECRCGYVYLGHAFAPCPGCRQRAGWIECERCGVGVRSNRN